MGTQDQPFVIDLGTADAPKSDWLGREPESLLPPHDLRIVRNVTRASLTVYAPPPERNGGSAVIVAPGGAFHFLAIAHEGTEVADWLVRRGVTAFVLRYRVLKTAERDEDFLAQLRENMANRERSREWMDAARSLAIADGLRAVTVVRQRATAWGVDPHRIGIIGFSAGGVVASGVALEHDEASRPDFVAPIYGAPWEDRPIPPNAPPMFLALASNDDMAVQTSLPLYTKWREAGRSVEMHIFAAGGHGFGMRKLGLPSDRWIDLYGDWLDGLGMPAR